jgi:hypothetical protein
MAGRQGIAGQHHPVRNNTGTVSREIWDGFFFAHQAVILTPNPKNPPGDSTVISRHS